MSETGETTQNDFNEQTENVIKQPDVDEGQDFQHGDSLADFSGLSAVAKQMLDETTAVDVSELLQQQQESKAMPAQGAVSEYLEELAHDMLGLIRRMRDVETAQQTLAARLEEVHEGWSRSSLTVARELDSMRRDLVGDRKHTALTTVFNELVPLIDRLRTMRNSLDEEADAQMMTQLNGVLETLSSSLRRLGCQEFDVKTGGPFDSDSMECAGYAPEGEPGVVMEVVRSGYRFDAQILRPATVIIANPNPTPPEHSGDNCDE